MPDRSDRPLDYQPHQARLPAFRVTLRPAILVVALIFISIGVVGYVVTKRHFTFLPQDPETLPATFWQAQAADQPWMDFGCSMMPIGVVGMILLPLALRFRRRQE